MKEWKIQVIEQLEENCKEVNAVLLRKAAIECGFKHIKVGDCFDIVKYSPPIEAGASFNPPNLAKDFILRASVSEAMGFL